MTDARDDANDEARATGPAHLRASRSIDSRYAQRNLARRLFPGPTQQMSRGQAEHVDRLLQSFGNEEQVTAWRERNATGGSPHEGSRTGRTPVEPPAIRPVQPADAAAKGADLLSSKLDEQSDLLRAILASSVDTQEDARATAQNSRTFAWAGTAIALLTLVATVISIIAAIRA